MIPPCGFLLICRQDAVLSRVASPGKDVKPFQAARSRMFGGLGVGVGAAWPSPVVRVVCGLIGACVAARDSALAKPALSRGCGILFS